MNVGHLGSLVLFSIGLALYTSLPFISGFVCALALLMALGADDDNDSNHPTGTT